jgi:hypothetical protein
MMPEKTLSNHGTGMTPCMFSVRATAHVIAVLLAISGCSKDEARPSLAPVAPAVTTTVPLAVPAREPPAAASATPATAPVAQAPTAQNPQPLGLRILLPPEEGDVLSIVRAQRVKALEEKRIFVAYVGATWCPPCVRFHDAIRKGELNEKLAQYTMMQFDLDRDGQRLLAAGYGSKFIPFFVLPGPDGKKAQSFEVKTTKKEEALREVVEGLLRFQK